MARTQSTPRIKQGQGQVDLATGISMFRDAAAEPELAAPDVSGWTVGMHVHHCCKAMIGVCEALLASAPPPPRRQFSLLAELVFLTGRIPRGRAKAPPQAIPRSDVTGEELLSLLDRSEELVGAARGAPPDRWFRHFAFGVLDRDRTLRFVQIHNSHHWRIIEEIMAFAEAGQRATTNHERAAVSPSHETDADID